MSVITTILSTIGSITVSVGAVTPSVRNYNQQSNSLNSADCPIRIIQVIGASLASDGKFVALGKLQKISWTVTDRLFWKPVSQGAGLEEFAGDLVAYIAAYLEAVRDNRQLTNQSLIISITCKPQIFTWGTTDYAGVDCTFYIDGYVSGA